MDASKEKEHGHEATEAVEAQSSITSKPSSRGSIVAEPEPEADGSKLQPTETTASEVVYPNTSRTILIMLCLYCSMFLVALDRTIIATAIPRITDDFHSIDDIGWYGSAYLLTACSFILVYGRIYTYYSTKWAFLTGILFFEIGSAICGAAPNSVVLIVGRAIAGFGSSGILTGAITIMINTVPLHKRPMYQGLFGAVFAVASVVGPLMGGAFTDSSATWRWCFYINLPLGGIILGGLGIFLNLHEKDKKKASYMEQLRHLDPIGTTFFLPAIICLLLALQWGGTKYAWGSWQLILLLVIFSVGVVVFIAVQYLTRNTTATLPARIATQRSVIFASIFQIFSGGTFMVEVFYIPVWLQAIKGSSAVDSGIQSIPLVLAVVVMALGCGALVQRIGYYVPFMWAGSIIMPIGAGLISTWGVDSGSNEWIGYQALLGFGLGCSMQQANLAVQTVLQHKDVPTGSSMIFFAQTLGGTIFISVAQNLFLDKFTSQLRHLPPGTLDMQTLLATGATELRNVVPAESLPVVLEAYNYALTNGPMTLCIITSCLTLLGSVGMEWRSTRERLNKKKGEDVEKAADGTDTATVPVEAPVPNEKDVTS